MERRYVHSDSEPLYHLGLDDLCIIFPSLHVVPVYEPRGVSCSDIQCTDVQSFPTALSISYSKHRSRGPRALLVRRRFSVSMELRVEVGKQQVQVESRQTRLAVCNVAAPRLAQNC
jgi:hypothetical protein